MVEITAAERAALAAIQTQTDPSRLRTQIDNARRQGSASVERAAFLRLCEIQPEARPGTVEHDVWQSIHALEEMMREERGRTTRLSRTRQKIARDGEVKTVSDLTTKPEASQGFNDLMERGHPELTFEAIVLRHPATFASDAVAAARRRLISAGMNPDDFTRIPKGT